MVNTKRDRRNSAKSRPDHFEIDVSVCIASWNNCLLLRDCLQSVYNTLSDMSHEVIVVDNGSQDGTFEMLATEFPSCVVIRNQENLGFTAAYNQAMQTAAGKYLLILNNDTILHPQSVQRMIEFSERDSRVGVVGCRLILPDGSVQRSCHHFPSLVRTLFDSFYLNRLFPRSRIFGAAQMTYWDYADTREVDWLAAAAWLVKRDVIDSIGYFDEYLFAFGEDRDWCYRCWQAGWKVVFLHTATITHLHGMSSVNYQGEAAMKVHRKSIIRPAAGYLHFFEKYGISSSRVLPLIAIKIFALSRAIPYALRFLLVRTPEALGDFKGYFDALRLSRADILRLGLRSDKGVPSDWSVAFYVH